MLKSLDASNEKATGDGIIDQRWLIEKIMLSQKLSDRGVYMARLFSNERWKLAQVDDQFPCTDLGELVYSQAVNGQIFVPILDVELLKTCLFV